MVQEVQQAGTQRCISSLTCWTPQRRHCGHSQAATSRSASPGSATGCPPSTCSRQLRCPVSAAADMVAGVVQQQRTLRCAAPVTTHTECIQRPLPPKGCMHTPRPPVVPALVGARLAVGAAGRQQGVLLGGHDAGVGPGIRRRCRAAEWHKQRSSQLQDTRCFLPIGSQFGVLLLC